MNGVAAPVEYNTEVHAVRKMSAGLRDDSDTVSDSNFISSVQNRISSIYDNPFYKSFGVRHPRTQTPREPSAPVRAKHPDTESTLKFREDLGEYKPGSGFVHKLMGRFASLSTREETTPSYHHIKHAGSVENILRDDHKAADGDVAQSGEERVGRRERGRESFKNLKQRAKSVDSVNNVHRKPHLQFPLRHVDKKWERPHSPTKPSRDSHIEAPDVTLARDDIILIENPPPELAADEEVDTGALSDRSQNSGTYLKDEALPDELPKPNTVLTVRSIFESAAQAETEYISRSGKPLSPTRDQGGLGDRDPPMSPTDPAARGQAFTPREARSTISQSSPRVVDAARMFEFPRTTELTRNGDRRSSWSTDVSEANSGVPSTTSEILSPLLSVTTVASSSSLSSTASSLSPLHSLIGEHLSDDRTVVTSDSGRSIPVSRSTAAVKAVPASRPVPPARSRKPVHDVSVNIGSSAPGVPPSFTPSVKKTSPVMPVAPFKQKAENDDENRYLVFASKKLNSKPSKPKRVKDYAEVAVNAVSQAKEARGEELDKKQVEADVQKVNKVNVLHSKGRAPPIPQDTVDGRDADLVQTPRLVNNSPDGWSSPRIEDAVKPNSLSTENIASRFVSDTELETVVLTNLSQSDSTEKQDFPAAMDTQEMTEPVKGIPRIIAQRMKQNSDAIHVRPPGELFGVRLGKTRHEDGDKEDGSEIPFKRLTPVQSAGKQEDTPNLPSEIENQIASVRKRMEAGSQSKAGGVSQIFDSSQLQKKRRENQAARAAAQAGVPRLDLSSLASDSPGNPGVDGGYRVTAREIKPCNIEFIGGNVSVGRSMLDKNRTVKINIRFHDVLVQTFEYPSEQWMLEEYLKDHPDEILVLQEDSGMPESSDDGDAEAGVTMELGDRLLMSSSALSQSATLQSYRGKFQQEYVMGSVFKQPEKPAPSTMIQEAVDPDTLLLRPADEDGTNMWSTNETSDLLF